MEKADNVTEVWKYETFRVRCYEAVKADRQAYKKSASSAHCLSCCGFMRVHFCTICTFDLYIFPPASSAA